MNYRIAQGRTLHTSLGIDYITLPAGSLVPAALIAIWASSNQLERTIAAGVIVEDMGEASPSSAPSPTRSRRPSSTRSAAGLALRRAQG
jgi:hypothetical protein